MTKEKTINELYELRNLEVEDVVKHWDKYIEIMSDTPLDKLAIFKKVLFCRGVQAGYETAIAILNTEDGGNYAETLEELFPMGELAYEGVAYGEDKQ